MLNGSTALRASSQSRRLLLDLRNAIFARGERAGQQINGDPYVFVVDDEPVIAHTLASSLRNEGYQARP